MKFEEYKQLPYTDQIALIQFAHEHSNVSHMPDDLWDSMISVLQNTIIDELEEITKQVEKKRQDNERQQQFSIWDLAFTKLIHKYSKRYRIFFGTVYMVIQEADDGITMQELRDHMAKDNWKHMSDYIFNIITEVYNYEEYEQKNGKIYYKNRTMSINKGWYDDWKKTFDKQIPWSLESALHIDIGMNLHC